MRARAASTAETHVHCAGVDGDYAHPQVLYTSLDGNKLVHHRVASWRAHDRVNSDDTASIHLEQPLNNTVSGAIGVVLSGIRIDMRCVDSQQPAGRTCNSNGIWPSALFVDVLGPKVVFNLTRTWTPLHGGGKPVRTIASLLGLLPRRHSINHTAECGDGI